MSRSHFRSQAHRKGERDGEVLLLLILIGIVVVTVVLWGVPSGLPS